MFQNDFSGVEAVTRGQKAASSIKRLTLDIPADLHRAIKLNALEEGVTMVEKLRSLLLEHYGLTDIIRK